MFRFGILDCPEEIMELARNGFFEEFHKKIKEEKKIYFHHTDPIFIEFTEEPWNPSHLRFQQLLTEHKTDSVQNWYIWINFSSPFRTHAFRANFNKSYWTWNLIINFISERTKTIVCTEEMIRESCQYASEHRIQLYLTLFKKIIQGENITFFDLIKTFATVRLFVDYERYIIGVEFSDNDNWERHDVKKYYDTVLEPIAD